MTVNISRWIVFVTSFLQQRDNPQPFVSDWAEQSINSDAYDYPSAQSLSSVENSEPTYSSIKSLNTNEDDEALHELPDDVDAFTDDIGDNLIYEITWMPTTVACAKPKQLKTLPLEKLTLP